MDPEDRDDDSDIKPPVDLVESVNKAVEGEGTSLKAKEDDDQKDNSSDERDSESSYDDSYDVEIEDREDAADKKNKKKQRRKPQYDEHTIVEDDEYDGIMYQPTP